MSLRWLLRPDEVVLVESASPPTCSSPSSVLGAVSVNLTAAVAAPRLVCCIVRTCLRGEERVNEGGATHLWSAAASLDTPSSDLITLR